MPHSGQLTLARPDRVLQHGVSLAASCSLTSQELSLFLFFVHERVRRLMRAQAWECQVCSKATTISTYFAQADLRRHLHGKTCDVWCIYFVYHGTCIMNLSHPITSVETWVSKCLNVLMCMPCCFLFPSSPRKVAENWFIWSWARITTCGTRFPLY